MSRRTPSIGLSLLDIISCALGAAVVLAILYSVIKTPIPPPVAEEFILVEASATGRGLMGFLVAPPSGGRMVAISPDPEGLGYANKLIVDQDKLASSIELLTGGAGSERSYAYLVIKRPAEGDWLIRPYFSQLERAGDNLVINSLEGVEIRVWTLGFSWPRTNRIDEANRFNLTHPGFDRSVGEKPFFKITIRPG